MPEKRTKKRKEPVLLSFPFGKKRLSRKLKDVTVKKRGGLRSIPQKWSDLGKKGDSFFSP